MIYLIDVSYKIIMVEIYALSIKEPFLEVYYDKCLSIVSQEQRQRVSRFCNLEDKIRTLYGDILIRYLMCKKLGLRNEVIIIDKNEYGKPFLKSHPQFHYNLSHSGQWIVCAISNESVGIDIEQIQPIDLDIAKSFFTIAESNGIMNKKIKSRLKSFYTIWTLKESFIKYLGKGLAIPLDSFEFAEENDRYKLANTYDGCIFKQFCFKYDYMIAVCHKESSICFDIMELDMDVISCVIF